MRLIILLLLCLFLSCTNTMYDQPVVIEVIDRGESYEGYRYKVMLWSSLENTTLYTDHYYVPGDTLR